MVIRTLFFLIGSLAGSSAFAAACHVSQNMSGAQVPAVVLESCYEFTEMPAEAINWSCSNESTQPQVKSRRWRNVKVVPWLNARPL